jgi:RNA polymerase sigma-70 factor (sigma-E family)
VDEAFAVFVDAHWTQLVRSAVLLGCSEDEAEDLAQTTLARCYVAWSKVDQARDTNAYLYRILINTLSKSRKRRWWGEHPTDVLPDIEATADPADAIALTSAVRQALLHLGVHHRTVLVLRFFADLSEQQTADVLGVPIGTVKSRVSRGLAQLSLDDSLTELLQS